MSRATQQKSLDLGKYNLMAFDLKQRRAIIRVSAGLLLVGPLITHFSDIRNRIQYCSEQEIENGICKVSTISSKCVDEQKVIHIK